MTEADRLMVGVSGIRGTVGGTLTPQVACDFGCAFGTLLRRRVQGRPSVVIGRDTRPSGPTFRSAVVAGLLACDVQVTDLGIVSTPGVALMTADLGADGGVVITASHNPAAYNGLKFLQPLGTGLTAEDAATLADIRQRGLFEMVPPNEHPIEAAAADTHERHVTAVCEQIDLQPVARRKFKVVLDSVNGAGCLATPRLLGRLGCDLVHLGSEPTGAFAHKPEPVAENLGDLCRAVAESDADVGFAQDADADRLAIVDENGTFIGEEYTLALAAAYVLSRRAGKVATNLATSRMIDDIAAAYGSEVIRAPTGEANVVEVLRREGCVIGGEGGGGVIEPRVVLVRDSLVGIAYVLAFLAETGKTVSQLVADLPRYVMRKTKLPCSPEAATRVIAAATDAFTPRRDARLNDADGLRADLPDGWVCVRPSNTEPILRIIAEAPDAARADALSP
ncbi:MAG: phosphoglucosamine mutase, partial [Phycisphaerae bacterium]|nr:phosphoglucosamine mutase [Phycisphaerae bacterium]